MSGGNRSQEPRLRGSALRLTVLIGESDRWHHKPLYAEIVHRAHAAGLAGASVFRGIEGFGASSLVHTTRLLSLSEDLPVAVVIVDTEERIRRFLPQLDGLVAEGLVLLDPCEVVTYTGRTGAGAGGDAPGGGLPGGDAAAGDAAGGARGRDDEGRGE